VFFISERKVFSIQSPTASITRNQDSPLNSVMPHISRASSSSAAPGRLNGAVICPSMNFPRIPPEPSGRMPPRFGECRRISPLEVASVTKKPSQRKAIRWTSRVSSGRRSRRNIQPLQPNIRGSRYAE